MAAPGVFGERRGHALSAAQVSAHHCGDGHDRRHHWSRGDPPPLVVLVFLPRSRVFEVALAGAVKAGQVTEELRAALHDPVDQTAHRAEEVVSAVVLFLMVVKPF